MGNSGNRGGDVLIDCRSELAREKRKSTAFIQDVRVIVDDFREQARSYSDMCKAYKTAVIL
ncbi:hypothetical protein DENIT_10534 [Pseudomonas veronii]|nr:hypothetical protein DENIT_10534 [Pseudomonas veronii]